MAGSAGSSGSAASAAGGRVRWVIRLRLTNSASGAPSRSGSGTITRVAPASSAMQISHTEVSKLVEANWRTRAAGVTARPSVVVVARLGMPAWVTTTPLGWPVEPDV